MTGVGAVLAALAVLAWPAGARERAVCSRIRGGAGVEALSAHQLAEELRRLARLFGLRLSRRTREFGEWLPVLDELAASLRVGLPPVETLSMALSGSPPPVGAVLQPVLDVARDGRPCASAWLRAAKAASSGELELLARSWAISERLGAPLADAVDSASSALRSQRVFSSRLDTATAGAQTTANILTFLPVAGVGIALLMGIAPTELYGSPAALASLASGLLMIAVGRVVVARMINWVKAQQ